MLAFSHRIRWRRIIGAPVREASWPTNRIRAGFSEASVGLPAGVMDGASVMMGVPEIYEYIFDCV